MHRRCRDLGKNVIACVPVWTYVGLPARAVVFVVLACGAGPACTNKTATPKAAANPEPATTVDIEVPTMVEGVIWQLLPESVNPDVDELSSDGTRQLIREGMRVQDWPDGTLELAPEVFPTGEVAPLPLPQHLGGGYLFSSEISGETSIWRSKTWVGPPTPVATLTERVERLVPGFDRLYVQLAHTNELAAFDLESGKLVDLGPLPSSYSYSSLAFADAWFGAVVTDVQGLLVSFDAGANWHPLDVSAESIQLQAEDGDILIHAQPETLRLSRTGEMDQVRAAAAEDAFRHYNDRQLGLSAEQGPSERPKRLGYALPLGPRPLKEAVLYGWPIDADQAVVATHGNLGIVRLSDGKLLSHVPEAYAGSEPCHAVRLGKGVGFICTEPGHGTKVHAFRRPLALSPVAAFSHQRHVVPSGNGLMVVRGSCEDEDDVEEDSRLYCVVGAQGPEREVRVRGDLGAERVVALDDGRVVVLIPPRLGSAGRLSLIADDVTSHELVLPKTTDSLTQLLEAGLWLDGVQQMSASSLGTWVVSASTYIGVAVDLDGRVRLPESANEERGDLGRTTIAGRFALEISASGIGWQTHDFGVNWQRFELPRILEPLSPSRLNRETGRHPVVGCSAVGCSYDPWLKIGYSANEVTDDDQAEQERLEQLEGPPETKMPERVALTPPAFADWHLECFATGEVNTAQGELRRELDLEANARPRSGYTSGYNSTLLSSTTNADIDSGAYLPFWGIPGPRKPQSKLLLDMGMEKPFEFHAYSWGDPGEAWNSTSGWLVRVATRFGGVPLWSTAATKTPWPDWVQAARLFGSDRADRYSSEWLLHLDADETSGVMWVTNRGNSELHVLEANRAIVSINGVNAPKPSSVARVHERLYVGMREGNRLDVHALADGQFEQVAKFPVGQGARAELIRTTDEERLGVFVHSMRGDWYVYPLDDALRPGAAIKLTRGELNAAPRSCTEDAEGWLVRATLPLSRLGPDSSPNTLALAEPYDRWRTRQVTAKVIVTEDNYCVSELAADTHGNRNRVRGERASVPNQASIPMTLTDRIGNQQLAFRCSP